MVDIDMMKRTSTKKKGPSTKAKKRIDLDKIMNLIKAMDKTKYPSCESIINRLQTHKRPAFIKDMVHLVNLCLRSGLDIWE